MKVIVEGVTVERVNEYNYLGTVLDNKLTFECNTTNIVKKFHQILLCLFRWIYFGVNPKTLYMFYCNFIETVLTFCLFCWFGTLSVKK